MKGHKSVPFVEVSFARLNAQRMATTGGYLMESVAQAPMLPENYSEIWPPFFSYVDRMVKKNGLRIAPEAVPEVAEALMVVKDGIREFHGMVTARLNSRNEAVWNAAQTLDQEFFSNGLRIVNDKQMDVIGWAEISVRSLEEEFIQEVRQVRVEAELRSLIKSLKSYKRIRAKYFVEPIEEPESDYDLLVACRRELGGVMIELVHCLKRHPEYAPIVEGMLRPLREVMAEVREEQRAKAEEAKKAKEEKARAEAAKKAGETESGEDSSEEVEGGETAPPTDDGEVAEPEEPEETGPPEEDEAPAVDEDANAADDVEEGQDADASEEAPEDEASEPDCND